MIFSALIISLFSLSFACQSDVFGMDTSSQVVNFYAIQEQADDLISREERGKSIESAVLEAIEILSNERSGMITVFKAEELLSTLTRKGSLTASRIVIKEAIRCNNSGLSAVLSVSYADLEKVSPLKDLIANRNLTKRRELWDSLINNVKEDKCNDFLIRIYTFFALGYYKFVYYNSNYDRALDLIKLLLEKEGVIIKEEVIRDALSYTNDVLLGRIPQGYSEEGAYRILLLLLETLHEPGAEIMEAAHSIALRGLESKDYFIRQDSLKLFSYLVKKNLFIQSAIQVARRIVDGCYDKKDNDIKQNAFYLFANLAEKGYVIEEAVKRAVENPDLALNLFSRLFKLGYGIEEAIKIANNHIGIDVENQDDSNMLGLQLLTCLVKKYQSHS